MLRYAITDRCAFPGDDQQRCDCVAAQARRLAELAINIIQLRERDLPERALESLAGRVVDAARSAGPTAPRVLLNGPAHIAVAAGADGVHLRGGAGAQELERVREAFQIAGLDTPVVSISCHSLEEARSAAIAGFDHILFGPVFEKSVRGERVAPGLGIDQLRQASMLMQPSRVLALGGVTEQNAPLCRDAGASGIAGIRLFL